MIKKQVVIALGVFMCLGTCVVWRHQRIQDLQQQMMQSGFWIPDMQAQDAALNLTGQALVLFRLTSEEYPSLSVKRVQVQETPSSLKLSLQGISGSLVDYYQKTEPYAFMRQLSAYTPQQELLSKPLLSLSVLEGNLENLNIFVSAYFAARNQILVSIDVYKGPYQKVRFVSKFTPTEEETLLSQLKAKELAFHLEYISKDWKEKLEDYCASKNLPFFVEDVTYLFSF